jgi:hypothetical protein
MFEKQGKFYADWRDKAGRRKRKSFTSPRAALRHEADQKEAAHPKQSGAVRLWPRSSSPSTVTSATVIAIGGRRGPSSAKPVRSRRANSQPATPPKSITTFATLGTPTQRAKAGRPRRAKSSSGSGKSTARKSSITKSANTLDSGRATSPSKRKKSTPS